jgi:hypothetical protein
MKIISTVFIILSILVFVPGCDGRSRPTGFLWYGQGGNIAILDLSDRTVESPAGLSGCSEAASNGAAAKYGFICQNGSATAMRTFSASSDSVGAVSLGDKDPFTDPVLSPAGDRTLFRALVSGDLFDIHMHFTGSNQTLFTQRVGAATFGRDGRSVYLGRGKDVFGCVVEDVTRLPVRPERLHSLFSGTGTIRDIDYCEESKRLAICTGTRVIAANIVGRQERVLFDAIAAEIPAPLRLPYRVRWSPDCRHAVAVVSPDGSNGMFALLPTDGREPVLIPGANPTVGGIAWTDRRPPALRR